MAPTTPLTPPEQTDDPEAQAAEAKRVKDGADAADAAARGEDDISPQQEKDALHYFLTAAKPPPQAVDVTLLTDDGPKDLVFVIRAMRGKAIEAIEERHRKGEPPFGRVDQQAVDAELVTEATVKVVDPVSGREIALDDPRFRQGVASPMHAMLARLEGQEGLLTHIANRIRSVSGWDSERVSEARRYHEAAAGG